MAAESGLPIFGDTKRLAAAPIGSRGQPIRQSRSANGERLCRNVFIDPADSFIPITSPSRTAFSSRPKFTSGLKQHGQRGDGFHVVFLPDETLPPTMDRRANSRRL